MFLSAIVTSLCSWQFGTGVICDGKLLQAGDMVYTLSNALPVIQVKPRAENPLQMIAKQMWCCEQDMCFYMVLSFHEEKLSPVVFCLVSMYSFFIRAIQPKDTHVDWLAH